MAYPQNAMKVTSPIVTGGVTPPPAKPDSMYGLTNPELDGGVTRGEAVQAAPVSTSTFIGRTFSPDKAAQVGGISETGDEYIAPTPGSMLLGKTPVPAAAPTLTPSAYDTEAPTLAESRFDKTGRSNPSLSALQDAGATGEVGTTPEWRTDGAGRTYQSTPGTGIRSIDTPAGTVYAGRDAKGQLQVASNIGQSQAEDETARAKEAARMTADLARQSDYFEREAAKSNLKSNNPADRKVGKEQMAAIEQRLARQGNPLDNKAKQNALDLTTKMQDLHKQYAAETDPEKKKALAAQIRLFSGKEGKAQLIHAAGGVDPTDPAGTRKLPDTIAHMDQAGDVTIIGNKKAAMASDPKALAIKSALDSGKLTREDATKQLAARGY